MNFKKIWDFIWHDDSFASWIVNVLIAFVVVKFLIYPGLGYILDTPFPIVAVVSGIMEHSSSLDKWWLENQDFYASYGITKTDFKNYKFTNGFNKGDIMILYSKKNIKLGDTIVFQGTASEPIIHRIIKLNKDGTYQTKGDNNPDSRRDEKQIQEDKIYGKAVIRLPYLGWLKILFVEFLNIFKA